LGTSFNTYFYEFSTLQLFGECPQRFYCVRKLPDALPNVWLRGCHTVAISNIYQNFKIIRARLPRFRKNKVIVTTEFLTCRFKSPGLKIIKYVAEKLIKIVICRKIKARYVQRNGNRQTAPVSIREY